MTDNIEIKIKNSSNYTKERINRVIGYMFALNHNFIHQISKIEDEEGELSIYWKNKPSKSDYQNCINVWSSELCCESNHVNFFL